MKRYLENKAIDKQTFDKFLDEIYQEYNETNDIEMLDFFINLKTGVQYMVNILSCQVTENCVLIKEGFAFYKDVEGAENPNNDFGYPVENITIEYDRIYNLD